MSCYITCYTLFDITKTGVLNRSKPAEDEDFNEWQYKRNTQINFDTILQAISLRSQPEITKYPKKIEISFNDFENFGFLFNQENIEKVPCWKFEFSIQHSSVFNDGINQLGALYNDCDQIPMILCGYEFNKLPTFLDCTPELKNIYFTLSENDGD